eukprot:403337321
MVNSQGGNQNHNKLEGQNLRKSKIRQPTVISTNTNAKNEEKKRLTASNKEDYPLQINSKRNLNAPLQINTDTFKPQHLMIATSNITQIQSQQSAEKSKKASLKSSTNSQSHLKSSRLQHNPSQPQLTKQLQTQQQLNFKSQEQANKENRSIEKVNSQQQPQKQILKKQTLFRNQSFVKSQRSIDNANAAINFKLKQLEIDISDQNDEMIANDSMLLGGKIDDSQIQNNPHDDSSINNIINNSDQLNCILDTYDKDYEHFQEHLDKMKQHMKIETGTSSKNGTQCNIQNELSNGSQVLSTGGLGSGRAYHSKKNTQTNRSIFQDKHFDSNQDITLSKSQNSAYKDRVGFYNPINTETVSSPKIIIQNLESQKTSKRNSDMLNTMSQMSQSNQESSIYKDLSVKVSTIQRGCHILSKRNLPNLKDCNSQGSMESTIQTERRCDAKLVIKLKNDIELLNELLQEEKERNAQLDHQLQETQRNHHAQQDENQTLIEKIEQLEFQLQEMSAELTNTKEYYEEMIQSLKIQLQHNNTQAFNYKEKMDNMMNLFSKIQHNTNNTESFKLSCDMSRGQDQTLQELSNQFNQTLNKEAYASQNKKFNILKQLHNHQNKSNNFSMTSQKNDDEQYATIKLNKVQESNNMNDTSINNSNILMTSECKQQQNTNHNDQNISASLSQYDNQNVKFLKYVNKSKILDASQNTSQFLASHSNMNTSHGLSNSRMLMKKRQGFKLSKLMNQSSVVDADDSVICEEAGVNVNNIKTSLFQNKKLEDQHSQQPKKPNLINIQINLNDLNIQEASPIEDQINSLLHQIDGHLLTQSQEFKQNGGINSSRMIGNFYVGDSQQFIVQNHQNLATFGGHQQVAQSLTGTQQLSLLWNNLKEDEREFYSKRLSFSNNQQNEEAEFAGFNINYDDLEGTQERNFIVDSSSMSPSLVDEESYNLWLQTRRKQENQKHEESKLQNIEVSLAKFRDTDQK